MLVKLTFQWHSIDPVSCRIWTVLSKLMARFVMNRGILSEFGGPVGGWTGVQTLRLPLLLWAQQNLCTGQSWRRNLSCFPELDYLQGVQAGILQLLTLSQEQYLRMQDYLQMGKGKCRKINIHLHWKDTRIKNHQLTQKDVSDIVLQFKVPLFARTRKVT